MKIYILYWEEDHRIEETNFEDFRRRFNFEEIDSSTVSIYTSREDAELHANQ